MEILVQQSYLLGESIQRFRYMRNYRDKSTEKVYVRNHICISLRDASGYEY